MRGTWQGLRESAAGRGSLLLRRDQLVRDGEERQL